MDQRRGRPAQNLSYSDVLLYSRYIDVFGSMNSGTKNVVQLERSPLFSSYIVWFLWQCHHSSSALTITSFKKGIFPVSGALGSFFCLPTTFGVILLPYSRQKQILLIAQKLILKNDRHEENAFRHGFASALILYSICQWDASWDLLGSRRLQRKK